MQRRAAARPQIGSSRRPEIAAREAKKMQRGGSKIRSGEQQRGRRLAAAGGQKHVSRRAKNAAAGSSAGADWQQNSRIVAGSRAE